MQIQLQNPRTGSWEFVNISEVSAQQLRGPEPKPTVVQVQQPRGSNSAHPLLIAGVVIGALFGLIACLPPRIRGWVVLGILGGIVWLFWRANTDMAQQRVGVTDAAPRAELVKEPEVRRAELVRMPASIVHK